MFVILAGDPSDWSLHGPFTTSEAATSWAESEITRDPWWVIDINEADGDLGAALEAYRALADGLWDMLKGDRLTDAHIPDDFQWLVRAMNEAADADPR